MTADASASASLIYRLISRRHTVGFKRVWMLDVDALTSAQRGRSAPAHSHLAGNFDLPGLA
jgi:hypothetical protein